jgi:Fur family zinc uptake transcriptional regulator
MSRDSLHDSEYAERRKPEAGSLNAKEQLIANLLREVPRPWKAYELIKLLSGPQGVTSPPTVYRALDRLVRCGLAHRLESLNAYVTCAHDCSSRHRNVVFAICETCGSVAEYDNPEVVERLMLGAHSARFAVRQMTLEVRGQCAKCGAITAPNRSDGDTNAITSPGEASSGPFDTSHR